MSPLASFIQGFLWGVGVFFVIYLIGYATFLFLSVTVGSALLNQRKREARYQWRKALDVNDDFMPGDRERTEAKLEKGLDAVGDKVVVSESDSGVKTASDDTKAKEKKGKGKKK